eukprot:sb/3461415/
MKEFFWEKLVVIYSGDDYGFTGFDETLSHLRKYREMVVVESHATPVTDSDREQWILLQRWVGQCNRPKQLNNQNWLFRSHDWLSVNQCFLIRSVPANIIKSHIRHDSLGMMNDDYQEASSNINFPLAWYGLVVFGGPYSYEGDPFPGTTYTRALSRDSVALLRKVIPSDQQIEEYTGGCDMSSGFIEQYPLGTDIVETLKNVDFEGETGRIRFGSDGRRLVAATTANIYNIVGKNPKIRHVGSWDGELKLTREVQFFSNVNSEQRNLRVGIMIEEPFISRVENCEGSGDHCFSGVAEADTTCMSGFDETLSHLRKYREMVVVESHATPVTDSDREQWILLQRWVGQCNRPKQLNNQNWLFRSHDWLSANQCFLIRSVPANIIKSHIRHDSLGMMNDDYQEASSNINFPLAWYGLVVFGGPYSYEGDPFPGTTYTRALSRDSVALLRKVIPSDQQIGEYTGGCDMSSGFIEQYPLGTDIVETLKNVDFEGETGRIRFGSDGRRLVAATTTNIYNIVGKNPKIRHVGSWDGELKLTREVQFFSNVNSEQRNLRVGIMIEEPFISRVENYLTCTKQSLFCFLQLGLSIEMIRELATRLNYTYTFHEVKEAGRKINNDWTGMLVTLFEKYQSDPDLPGKALAPEHTGKSGSDCIYMVLNPTFDDHDFSLGDLFAEGYSNDAMFFISPFAANLWLTIFVTGFLLWMMVWIYEKFSSRGFKGTFDGGSCECDSCRGMPLTASQQLTTCPRDERLPVQENINAMDCNIGTDTSKQPIRTRYLGHVAGYQPTSDQKGAGLPKHSLVIPMPVAPRSASSRIVATCWWTVCLIMFAMYSANLTATITRQSVSKVMRSVKDVMVTGSGLSFGTVNNSITAELISGSDDFILREFSRRLSYVSSFEEGIEQARNGSYAFLSERIPLWYAATQPPCNLYVSGTKALDYTYSLLYNKRLADKKLIDLTILSMINDNVFETLWRKLTQHSFCKPTEQVESTKPLELGCMFGVFLVTIPLIGLALFVFVCEIVRGRKRPQRYHHRSSTGFCTKPDKPEPPREVLLAPPEPHFDDKRREKRISPATSSITGCFIDYQCQCKDN